MPDSRIRRALASSDSQRPMVGRDWLLPMKASFQHLTACAAVAALAAAGAAFAATAADNYDTHCAKCHGPDGKGQTKMGKKLEVRDMTTEAYKKQFDEAKAVKVLKEGIKKDGKEVKKSFASELSEADMKALVGYVKGLK